MPIEAAQTTLREDLEASFDSIEKVSNESTAVEQRPEPVQLDKEPKESSETESQKAERLRDDKGRFAKDEGEKEGGKEGEKSVKEAKPEQEVKTEVKVEKPRPPRPSTWKKDYWGHWEQIDPDLASYLSQRESEFAKGVSTYKQEFDRVKPIADVVESFRPVLEQQGIDPAKQIGRYFEIHKTMATGSPEQKLAMFMQMAQEYQVPVQQMFVRGQDGQIYFNQQLMQQAAQTQQRQAPQPVDVEKIVEAKLAEKYAMQEIQHFASLKDATGNPVHQYYEAVKDTMAKLLEAGVAEDLDSAYDAALRLPQHSDIYESVQQEQRDRAEAEKQRKLREETERAKRNAVSVKGQTPKTKTPGTEKSLREELEESYDSVVSARV